MDSLLEETVRQTTAEYLGLEEISSRTGQKDSAKVPITVI